MNIMLNNYCNLKCSYCFANCDPKNKVDISDDNYGYIIDFFKKSAHADLRLLGGEPTLHPNFEKWVNQGIDDPFFRRIQIFTNAIALDNALSRSIVDNKVSFLINLNGPDVIGEHLYKRTIGNVENLVFEYRRKNIEPQVTLGINIFEPDFQYQYIIEQSKRLKLKTIRYSITVPSDNNQKGSLEHYESFVPGLVDFLDDCHRNGISPHVDCNNPPKCIFSNEQLVNFIYSGFDLIHKGICSPVMDIRPDLSVARCFVFEDYLSVNIKDFNTVQEVSDFFLRKIDSRRYSNPPFKQCSGCRFWEEKKCIGGCLGYSVRGKLSACNSRNFS
ncbi:radical SAM protein [Dehalobacter sp.]|uniref:radical SAM protein n=1 Tax=Dehalobacter sp. TaxID=1962289 RepID=UPI00258FD357|nr:radical SAM protein [Dehalobacter sp.]MDJ0306773.1 radical SAM protein [Dehalobacter sp.]